MAAQAQWVGVCAQLEASRRAPLSPAAAAAVAGLQQQREARAQALADYLLAASSAPESADARARLQDRARASTDAMLTVLALHMPCIQPGCRSIEAAQWSRLEPANLLAWLALPVRASDADYLLAQIDTQVRYVRDYRAEVAAMMDPWGYRGSDGVMGESGLLLNLRALAASCPQELPDATRAQRCEKVADLLWMQGGELERLTALSLVPGVLLWLPERQALWRPRQQTLDDLIRRLRQLPAQPSPREAVCRRGSQAGVDEWQRAWLMLRPSGLSPDRRPVRREPVRGGK